MKKLVLLFVFFSTLTMSKSPVGFDKNEACPTGHTVFFDKTMVDLNRSESFTVDICVSAKDFDYRISRRANQIFIDVSYTEPLTFSASVWATPFPIPIHIYDNKTRDIDVNVRFYSSGGNPDLPSFNQPSYRQYTQTVKVLAKNQSSITDPSGSWYQPSLNGTGFVVMQFGTGTVVQYYGYDTGGKRLWLLSNVVNETWIKGEAKTLVMYEGRADTNTNFTTPPANAPGVVEWGNVEIQFDSCTSGYAKLSGVDGEQTFDLVKLANPSAVDCVEAQ